MVGDKIREFRKERGWSQEELALKAGYKEKTAISKIEKNINQLTQSKIKRFADVFGCDVADFFEISPVSQEELLLIEQYRKSDEATQETVRRILTYAEQMRIINENRTDK